MLYINQSFYPTVHLRHVHLPVYNSRKLLEVRFVILDSFPFLYYRLFICRRWRYRLDKSNTNSFIYDDEVRPSTRFLSFDRKKNPFSLSSLLLPPPLLETPIPLISSSFDRRIVLLRNIVLQVCIQTNVKKESNRHRAITYCILRLQYLRLQTRLRPTTRRTFMLRERGIVVSFDLTDFWDDNVLFIHSQPTKSTDVSGQISTHFGGQTRTFDEYLASTIIYIIIYIYTSITYTHHIYTYTTIYIQWHV